MNLFPLVERELRVCARWRGLYRLRVLVAMGATLLACLLMLNATTLTPAAGHGGRGLFRVIIALAFGVCVLAGPLSGADSLASERRSGTLDLILLAGIRGPAIIAAKLVALSLPALQWLVATLPVVALAFFVGGVSGTEFVHTAIALANTLFLSLSITLACSTMTREGLRALAFALIIMLGWNFLLPLAELAWWQHTTPGTIPSLFMPTPAYALLFSNDLWAAANPGGYWRAVTQGQLASWAALIGTALVLPGLQRRSPIARTQLSSGRFGRANGRFSRPNEDKPLLWLARRQTSQALGPSLAVFLFAPTLLVVHSLTTDGVLPWVSDFVGLWLVGLIFKLWLAWSACRGFAEDRESGALELLLVAPLDHREVWRARLAVLKRQFLGALLALVTVALVMVSWKTNHRLSLDEYLFWYGATLVTILFLLADTYTLSWVGLWQGLTARTATLACARALLWVLVVPMVGVLFVTGMTGMFDANPGQFALVLLGGYLVVGLVTDVTAGILAMIWVSDRFRTSVAGFPGSRSRRPGTVRRLTPDTSAAHAGFRARLDG